MDDPTRDDMPRVGSVCPRCGQVAEPMRRHPSEKYLPGAPETAVRRPPEHR